MKEKQFRMLRALGQAVVLYTLYAIVSFLACLLLQTDNFDRNLGNAFWTHRLYFQVSYFYSMITFFSLASVFSLYDSALQARFLEARPRSLIGACAFILTDRLFWVRCAVLGALAALFNVFPPHLFFRIAFAEGKETHVAWLLGALSVLLFMLVYFLAVLSTVSWWGMISKKSFERKTGVLPFLFQLVYTTVLWLVGGYLMALIVPMTSGFFKLVYRYFVGFLLVAVAALLVYAVIRYGGAMRQRKKLIKQLSRECERQGLSFAVEGHPYLGLLHQTQPCTVTIRDGKNVYVCRLVGGMQAKNSLYLREDGEAEYTRFYIWWSHVITERYFFEADAGAKKILLICPCRGRVFTTDGSAERELRSGDRTMGYAVYAGEDFLNALKRKCV